MVAKAYITRNYAYELCCVLIMRDDYNKWISIMILNNFVTGHFFLKNFIPTYNWLVYFKST